jgi:uncharacterized protein involved in exopolysaccharide biosynthesis
MQKQEEDITAAVAELERRIIIVNTKVDTVKHEHFKLLDLSLELYKSYIEKKDTLTNQNVQELKSKVSSTESSLINERGSVARLADDNKKLASRLESNTKILQDKEAKINELQARISSLAIELEEKSSSLVQLETEMVKLQEAVASSMDKEAKQDDQDVEVILDEETENEIEKAMHDEMEKELDENYERPENFDA